MAILTWEPLTTVPVLPECLLYGLVNIYTTLRLLTIKKHPNVHVTSEVSTQRWDASSQDDFNTFVLLHINCIMRKIAPPADECYHNNSVCHFVFHVHSNKTCISFQPFTMGTRPRGQGLHHEVIKNSCNVEAKTIARVTSLSFSNVVDSLKEHFFSNEALAR